jgi:glycosyltransferase involved in cell wall biosynthesis
VKILLLNQVFYPDVVATAQYLSDLAAALAEQGHEVTVVSGRRAYEHPETIFPAHETWRGVKILRIFSTRFGKDAKWRRAADFASFLFFCCVRLLFLPRQDVVVALTTPPLISFLGAWRAKLWRARFCYWVMDFNPDEAIAAGWLRVDSFTAKFLERLSMFSLRRADKIIALDRFMRDRIAAKNIASEKIAVISPWSLDRQVKFDPLGREEFRAAHGLAGKFVVMYSGNHSPVHPLDTLMQAAELLRAETDIVFCFIGGGSEFSRVKKWAKKNPQVICLPYQPLDKLSASLSAADAQVVVMGDAMLGLVHPSKIYNILTVGAPVIYIGPGPSHVTEILAGMKPRHPWIGVRHGAAGELAKQIPQLRRESAGHERRTLAVVEADFSQAALLPRLAALVESPGGKM